MRSTGSERSLSHGAHAAHVQQVSKDSPEASGQGQGCNEAAAKEAKPTEQQASERQGSGTPTMVARRLESKLPHQLRQGSPHKRKRSYERSQLAWLMSDTCKD